MLGVTLLGSMRKIYSSSDLIGVLLKDPEDSDLDLNPIPSSHTEVDNGHSI